MHQTASLVTVQADPVTTLNGEVPAGEGTVWLSGVTVRVGAVPAWVTVTATGVNPVTVTVRLATLAPAPVFSSYVAVIVPFPVPEGVIVHHTASLMTDHAELLVTEKEVFPAEVPTL